MANYTISHLKKLQLLNAQKKIICNEEECFTIGCLFSLFVCLFLFDEWLTVFFLSAHSRTLHQIQYVYSIQLSVFFQSMNESNAISQI